MIKDGGCYLDVAYEEVGPLHILEGANRTWYSENQYGIWDSSGVCLQGRDFDLYPDMPVGSTAPATTARAAPDPLTHDER